MPDSVMQVGRHNPKGLDAKQNRTLQSSEEIFLLTSPFIEPCLQQFPELTIRDRRKMAMDKPLRSARNWPDRDEWFEQAAVAKGQTVDINARLVNPYHSIITLSFDDSKEIITPGNAKRM
jgi:hypothetical protein